MVDILLPAVAVIFFFVMLILALKKNPSRRRNVTKRAMKDIALKMECPVCGYRMKKAWNKREAAYYENEPGFYHTFIEEPVFTCPECGKVLKKADIRGGEKK